METAIQIGVNSSPSRLRRTSHNTVAANESQHGGREREAQDRSQHPRLPGSRCVHQQGTKFFDAFGFTHFSSPDPEGERRRLADAAQMASNIL